MFKCSFFPNKFGLNELGLFDGIKRGETSWLIAELCTWSAWYCDSERCQLRFIFIGVLWRRWYPGYFHFSTVGWSGDMLSIFRYCMSAAQSNLCCHTGADFCWFGSILNITALKENSFFTAVLVDGKSLMSFRLTECHCPGTWVSLVSVKKKDYCLTCFLWSFFFSYFAVIRS